MCLLSTKYAFMDSDTIPSITEMNRHFVIKWRKHEEKSSQNRLIGAGKYEEKFGESYMEKHFTKAMDSGEKKVIVKIRGLYVITFSAK